MLASSGWNISFFDFFPGLAILYVIGLPLGAIFFVIFYYEKQKKEELASLSLITKVLIYFSLYTFAFFGLISAFLYILLVPLAIALIASMFIFMQPKLKERFVNRYFRNWLLVPTTALVFYFLLIFLFENLNIFGL